MKDVQPAAVYARIAAMYDYKLDEIPERLSEPMLLVLATSINHIERQRAAAMGECFGEVLFAFGQAVGLIKKK